MRYKAIPKDSSIDPEVALLQGALALDAAGEVAEGNRDVEGLLNVSAMWMKFSEAICGFSEKMEESKSAEEIVKTSKEMPVGFCAPAPEVEPITVEEDEND